MIWINFLHLYQPANADFKDIKEALEKSYWRLIRLLDENPGLKFTLNVAGCLLERLDEEGEKEFAKRLKNLLNRGQIELTGSAAYHPLLPLLPEKEIVWQIKENERILKKFFGQKVKLKGFFLPEMAYSSPVAKIIKRLGYRWLILDENAFSGGGERHPAFDQGYIDQNSDLKIVFRNKELSSGYAPEKLILLAGKIVKKRTKQYLVTATDSELYGLRHEDPTAELEKLAKLKSVNTITISEFIQRWKKLEKIKIYSSSWESSLKDLKSGQPFRLWLDQKNQIQVALWKMLKLCLEAGDKFKKDKNYEWYRWHLNRGMASCTFWWASDYDFSYIFGPRAWNPDMIEKGVEDLVRSIRSLMNPKSKRYKLLAEKQYIKIKSLIWEEHWKKHW